MTSGYSELKNKEVNSKFSISFWTVTHEKTMPAYVEFWWSLFGINGVGVYSWKKNYFNIHCTSSLSCK